MSATKSVTLKPLEAGLLYLCMKSAKPEINSQAALVEFMANRYEELGWKLVDHQLATRSQDLKLGFEGDETLEGATEPWEIIVGVERRFLGYRRIGTSASRRAPSKTGGPKWTGIAIPVLAISAFVGGLAYFFQNREVPESKLANQLKNKNDQTLNIDGGNAPPAPTPRPAATKSPAPAASPAPPVAAAAARPLAKGQSGPTPEALAKDLLDARAAIASVERARSAKKDAPTVKFQARPNIARGPEGEPFRQNFAAQPGPQNEAWVARKFFDAQALHPGSPVIYLEYRYDLGSREEATLERWWFNLRDDYIEHEAVDFRGNRITSAHHRVLAGNLPARAEAAAKPENKLGFRSSPTEAWASDRAADGVILERFLARLQTEGFGPDMIEKLVPGKRADEAVLSVRPAWNQMSFEVRLEKAQKIWKLWSINRYPVEPDQIYLRIVNTRGEKVGGSTMLGANISVVR